MLGAVKARGPWLAPRSLAALASQHPELKRSLDELTDEQRFAAAVVEAGKRAGYSFDEQQVKTVLQSRRPPPDELGESELAGVSGGLAYREGNKDKDSGFSRTDVLVSSY